MKSEVDSINHCEECYRTGIIINVYQIGSDETELYDQLCFNCFSKKYDNVQIKNYTKLKELDIKLKLIEKEVFEEMRE